MSLSIYQPSFFFHHGKKKQSRPGVTRTKTNLPFFAQMRARKIWRFVFFIHASHTITNVCITYILNAIGYII